MVRGLLAGRYQIRRRVGAGGMGVVYLARDRLLERDVAVKVLAPALAADPRAVARFKGEARAAASINHPAVVSVFDSGSDGAVHYLVTEYVEGITVSALLKEHGRLPVRRALEIAGRVAEALSVAHRADIVHRDVKPGNVIVTEPGDAKIMDFGIARAMSSAEPTRTAQVLGTVSYLSPEQARGGTADARSDLYALGAMVYEMVTGRPPFVADTPLAVAYQHLHQPPTPPSELDPDIPRSVDALILRALAKDPEERYPHAEAFIDDVMRVLVGEEFPAVRAAAAVPPSRGDDTGELPSVEDAPAPPWRRGRWLVAAALAATLGISVPLVAFSVGGSDREPQQAPSEGSGVQPKGNDAGSNEAATETGESTDPPAPGSSGDGRGGPTGPDEQKRPADREGDDEASTEEPTEEETEAEPSPSPSVSPSPSPAASPTESPDDAP